MRRKLLTIGTGLITFVLGVSATVVYWIHQLPEPIKLEEPEYSGLVPSSCFPGLAVKIDRSESYPTYLPLTAGTYHRTWDEWYSKVLIQMKEKPLVALTDEEESYRFLWLRSFNNPIAVHVYRKGSEQTIIVKELAHFQLEDPGELLNSYALRLSTSDWNRFMLRLELARYWQIPADQGPLANDGAQWVLEGYREGRYHVVDRQSPEPGAYRNACLFLLEKSGLLSRIPPKQVY